MVTCISRNAKETPPTRKNSGRSTVSVYYFADFFIVFRLVSCCSLSFLLASSRRKSDFLVVLEASEA